ncbi:MAG: hypothetical protein ABI402_07735 [Ferruginibacter sp.]
MNETTFYIGINIKTPDGFDSIGKFYIGNNREAAYALFKQLEGNKDMSESSMLTMELLETVGTLPLNLQLISCSLEKLGCNCRLITKEVFKLRNLEDAG